MSAVTARQAEVPPPFPPRPSFLPLPEVRVPPPLVFVEAAWEYRHLTRAPAAGGALTEAELNELGAGGWELVAVLGDPAGTHFYFKRQLR